MQQYVRDNDSYLRCRRVRISELRIGHCRVIPVSPKAGETAGLLCFTVPIDW